MLDAKFIASEFLRLHAAIRADGYRCTIQYAAKDGRKIRAGHGIARVLDPRSKDFSSPPLAVQTILDAIPAIIRFSEREDLIARVFERKHREWRSIPARANVFLTPLSKDRHHPIIDDVWSSEKCDDHPDPEQAEEKRRKFEIFDYYYQSLNLDYAVEIESSPGNHQFIFNIHRQPDMFLNDVFVDDTETDYAANMVIAKLNEIAGDNDVKKVQQAFRFPGFVNRKAIYINDGIVHPARLISAEHVFCDFLEQEIVKAAARIDEEKLAKKTSTRIDGEKREHVNVGEGTFRATNRLYAAHAADIRRHIPEIHYIKLDIMIAARLFVTGHTAASIADAIRGGTTRARGKASYARGTARKAGKKITPEMEANRDLWRIIESGDACYQNDDPGIPALLARHEKAEQLHGARGNDAVELAALAMFYCGHSRAAIERSIQEHRPDLDAKRIARNVSSTQNGFWQSIIRKTLPRWRQAEEAYKKDASRPRPKIPRARPLSDPA